MAGGSIVYVLSTAEPLGATFFIVVSVVVVGVDTFLKPVLLGRKADSPMMIVLLGAIGGMMLCGMAGLFVGAVVLGRLGLLDHGKRSRGD